MLKKMKIAAKLQLNKPKISPELLQKFSEGLPKNFHKQVQEENLQAHHSAFSCFKAMLDLGLQLGDKEMVEIASKGMERHSREVFKYSGLSYYADINAAADKLTQAGYLVVDPTETEEFS
jgi:hypothetical protein